MQESIFDAVQGPSVTQLRKVRHLDHCIAMEPLSSTGLQTCEARTEWTNALNRFLSSVGYVLSVDIDDVLADP